MEDRVEAALREACDLDVSVIREQRGRDEGAESANLGGDIDAAGSQVSPPSPPSTSVRSEAIRLVDEAIEELRVGENPVINASDGAWIARSLVRTLVAPPAVSSGGEQRDTSKKDAAFEEAMRRALKPVPIEN